MKKLLPILSCLFIFCANAQIYVPKKLKGKAGKYFEKMVYIPGDTLFTDDHLYTKSINVKPKVKAVVKAFHMSQYEASYDDWRPFYNAMVAKHGIGGAARYLPDSTCWNMLPLKISEPMVRLNYFNYPIYGKLPVAGITYNQVLEYIQWKNTQTDSLLKAQHVTGYKILFRLPTAIEMEHVLNVDQNPHYGFLGYKGYLANFGSVIDTSGYIFKFPSDDGYENMAPINSFNPNNYGLYNILGNIDEWTSDAYTGTETYFDYDSRSTLHPNETNTTRYVCKGGSWYDSPHYLRKNTYKALPANACSPYTGFRLAMDVIKVE